MLAKKPAPSLAELIEKARAEANAFIDAKAAELKASPTGRDQPIAALRHGLTRGDFCTCRAAERLLEGK